jgi:hypothetical protein
LAVLIAYLSIDEVNGNQAVRLGEGRGVQVEIVWPRDQPPDGRFDAVVYDLDCLTPTDRQRLLSQVLAAPSPRPVVVHGYGLDDSQADALRRNGIAVYRRLEPALFSGLCLTDAPAA